MSPFWKRTSVGRGHRVLLQGSRGIEKKNPQRAFGWREWESDTGFANGIIIERDIHLCPHQLPIQTNRAKDHSDWLMGQSGGNYTSAFNHGCLHFLLRRPLKPESYELLLKMLARSVLFSLVCTQHPPFWKHLEGRQGPHFYF